MALTKLREFVAHVALSITAHGGIVADSDARLTNARTPTTHDNSKHTGVQGVAFTVLANDTLAQDLAANINTQITVTANRTLTTTVPPAGTRCAVKVLTSGSTGYTITFGTGFKPSGTLATGAVTARFFIINWLSDGTNLLETGRTAAIAA